MSYFMGIDGGGSHLRGVIVDGDLNVVAEAQDGTANPSSVGRQTAAARIHTVIRKLLAEFTKPIEGIGIGIAGASATHSSNWLRETVQGALPATLIVPSSDYEIALVGAHGERRGILLLAGTGSVAYGINDQGEQVQAGGWGYLIGDEGSGYWIGIEGLKAVTRFTDYPHPDLQTSLEQRVYETFGIRSAHDLIAWLYRSGESRTREIAQLAPLVLEAAASGDAVSNRIVGEAAEHLAALARKVVYRLNEIQPRIAFAGGILQSENILSERVRRLLDLPIFPQTRYPPVIGAALLAKITLENHAY